MSRFPFRYSAFLAFPLALLATSASNGCSVQQDVGTSSQADGGNDDGGGRCDSPGSYTYCHCFTNGADGSRRCNDDGLWGRCSCDEVGGDGGTVKPGRTCSGTPKPCNEALYETSCTAFGCNWAPPQCSGEAKGCGAFSATVCDHVPGCHWAPVFNVYDCVGTAVACDERSLTGNCDVLGKTGCTLKGGCSGTPSACEDRTAEACTAGCSIR